MGQEERKKWKRGGNWADSLPLYLQRQRAATHRYSYTPSQYFSEYSICCMWPAMSVPGTTIEWWAIVRRKLQREKGEKECNGNSKGKQQRFVFSKE